MLKALNSEILWREFWEWKLYNVKIKLILMTWHHVFRYRCDITLLQNSWKMFKSVYNTYQQDSKIRFNKILSFWLTMLKRNCLAFKKIFNLWKDVDQLILNIKDHYVIDKAIKLAKKYFNDFDKIIQRLQFTVFQRCEKIDRKIRTIIAYILNDFRRAYNNELTILFEFNRKNLQKFELIIQEYKLIENS